jgi:DNA-binding beta-propeller fold protein YncE
MKSIVFLVSTFTAAISVNAAPVITSVAGTGQKGYTGDGGPATQAKLDQPFDVLIDAAGNLYFSDTNNHAVRKVDGKSGVITTVAGTGTKGFSGDGGPAVKAQLFEPYGIDLDADGNLYIVDRLNRCVRRVDAKGIITTIAGVGGKSGFEGDGGPANKALLKEPNGIALDGKGRLFIADVGDQRVRVLDLKTGNIDTFAGNGKGVAAGDGGPVKEATFAGPRAVVVSPKGDCLYVVERQGNSVRKIDFATGKVTRVAGTGKKGYTGDGSKALDATFDGPKEIAVDAAGNLFVVDTENEAIRRIDIETGLITTVAGKGKTKTPGLGDGGPPTQGTLGRPHGVAVGPDGAIYIGDTNSHRIRKVK